MSARFWLITGGLCASLAVVFGAFAAHGLEGTLAEIYGDETKKLAGGFEVPAAWKYLQDFKSGADYQMTHALGLLAVGLLALRAPSGMLFSAGWCLLGGVVFFSGALYALVLTGQKWWGAVAPLGGTAMIVGWVLLAVAAAKQLPKSELHASDA